MSLVDHFKAPGNMAALVQTYPQQTTIGTSFPTTVSGEAGTYSTASVSPLPGPFQTQEATTTDDAGEDGDEEPTQTSGFTSEETGAAAGREMSSTLAMAVLLMVLCCL